MELGLEGRRCVVTGGTKGIGRAVCEELLREGASVAFCARDTDEVKTTEQKLRATYGDRAFGHTCDVTAVDAVGAFTDEVGRTLGGIDVLVNNAGASHPGNFEDLSDHDWQADLDLKLFSQIRCTRAALPFLRQSPSARVVNVNAIYAKHADPAFMATTVIRAACLNLTKTLAQQYGKDGILVNSVNIGFVVTPQWENIRRKRAPDSTREEYFSALATAEVPLGRFGRVDEVSGVIAFLVSDRSSYVTGAMIDVAGGMGKYV